ncbi:MAG TPA: ABC transporter substrate-binding protein [Phycisphaerales bacterium]|nr:ABC transporter substrate-binding protein [Phycisphaerales bacterium]
MGVGGGATRVRMMALAALLAMAASCPARSGDGEKAAAPTPAPKATPAPRTAAPKQVRIGYFANVTHAQALLGVDSGDFAKAVAPSTLVARTFNAGPSLIESLFAGEIDIGYIGPSPAVNAFVQSRGKGIRVIAGAAANGVVVVARPGSGIRTLADLKGKRLATPQLGNTQDISARHYLETVLMQTGADGVMPIANAEQAAMMSRGRIDAAWAVEPWASRLVAEAGGVVVAEEKELWPDRLFPLTLVVATPEFLEQHRDVVERLLVAHTSWTKRLAERPREHVASIAGALEKLGGKGLSEDLLTAALSRVVFTSEPMPSEIATFATWASDLGLARSVPDVGLLVDTRCLERARASSTHHAGAVESAGAASPEAP